MKKSLNLIFLLILLLPCFSFAQEDENDDWASGDGTVYIEESTDKKSDWFENPNGTRYLIMPSAISLRQGTGYYQNLGGTFNSAYVGVTNNITVGGGFELISVLLRHPAFFVAGKVSVPVAPYVHVGAGAIYGTIVGPEFSSPGAGIAFGMGTVGTEDYNFTVGTGWGFFDGEFAQRPMVTLSGAARVSRRVSLVTENWLIPRIWQEDGYYPVFSYGARIMGPRSGFDVGFINTPDVAQFLWLGIPYIGYTHNFGGRRRG